MKELNIQKLILKNSLFILFVFVLSFFVYGLLAQQKPITINNQDIVLSAVPPPTCGNTSFGSSKGVSTSIDFGCSGKGNPIFDLTFAIIRFLVNGVGVVIIASTIYAGIQYILSSGDPQKINTAITRIRSNVIALILFIFTYAIIDYLVPGGLLK